jgi:hypothetical protein
MSCRRCLIRLGCDRHVMQQDDRICNENDLEWERSLWPCFCSESVCGSHEAILTLTNVLVHARTASDLKRRCPSSS